MKAIEVKGIITPAMIVFMLFVVLSGKAQTTKVQTVTDVTTFDSTQERMLAQIAIINNWSTDAKAYPLFIKLNGHQFESLLFRATRYIDLGMVTKNSKETFDISISIGDDQHYVNYKLIVHTGCTYLSVVSDYAAGSNFENNGPVPSKMIKSLIYLPNDYTVRGNSTTVTASTLDKK